MKPYKLFLIFSIILAIFVTPLGCAGGPRYTVSEWEEEQEQEEEKGYSTTTEDYAKQKEIDDYYKELRETQ